MNTPTIRPYVKTKDSYLEVAKQTARILHECTWNSDAVNNVVLIGSTAREGETPKDIDLVLIHSSMDLPTYSEVTKMGVQSIFRFGSNQNLVFNPSYICYTLGYPEGKEEQDGVAAQMIDLMKEQIQTDDSSLARKALDDLFDIHPISEGAFSTKSWNNEYRTDAMANGNDPTFWYTVLDKAYAYNTDTGEFDRSVRSVYPRTINKFKPSVDLLVQRIWGE